MVEKSSPGLNAKMVAIAGASGFVGSQLAARLAPHSRVVALGRGRPQALLPNSEWRTTDLFSATSTQAALRGAHTAIYLVHSMMPSSRLFQGSFHDTDLLLADNFARACVADGVKHIIYLGGLMPEGYVSPHLQSRLEVEEVLSSTGIPFTALRAGMIVGAGGSSFEILRTLVQRLPAMVLPQWTQRTTQAVHVQDVVSVIEAAVGDPRFQNQILDVVTGEALTYEILLRQMASGLGKRRLMIPVPIRSTQFSKLWVQIFGSSTYELVSPLIDSLLCDLPPVQPPPLISPLLRFRTFRQMITEVLAHPTPAPAPRRARFSVGDVRSIQRLPSLPGRSSQWIAQKYMEWLPSFLPHLLRVDAKSDGLVEFRLTFFPKALLILQAVPGSSDEDRVKFHIVGGLLTKTKNTGWLEFRQVSHKKFTLAAIHEFVPSLPWMVYLATQAPLHKFAMHRFGKYLGGLKERA